jgi:hypothetical protein
LNFLLSSFPATCVQGIKFFFQSSSSFFSYSERSAVAEVEVVDVPVVPAGVVVPVVEPAVPPDVEPVEAAVPVPVEAGAVCSWS